MLCTRLSFSSTPFSLWRTPRRDKRFNSYYNSIIGTSKKHKGWGRCSHTFFYIEYSLYLKIDQKLSIKVSYIPSYLLLFFMSMEFLLAWQIHSAWNFIYKREYTPGWCISLKAKVMLHIFTFSWMSMAVSFIQPNFIFTIWSAHSHSLNDVARSFLHVSLYCIIVVHAARSMAVKAIKPHADKKWTLTAKNICFQLMTYTTLHW